jgi:hypothetical protein
VAADLSALPDGFVLDPPKAAPTSGLPDGFVLDPPHPALAGLPKPADAVQQAELNAKQVADMLTHVGNQMQQSAIPHALRGYTPQELAQPSDTFNRAGRRFTVGDEMTPAPVLDSPISGGKKILDGAGQVATGLTEPSVSDGHTMGMYGVPLPAPPMNPTIAGGAAKVLGGGLEAATPLLPAAITSAPLETVGGLGAGMLAQEGTEAGLKKAGVPDGYAELGGAGAGLVAGGVAGHLAGKLGPKPAIMPDNVLGPERAPMEQQLPGEVSGENDGLAGKQPVGSRVVKPGTASAPPEGFVVDPPPGRKSPVARTSETKAKEGETNDNRTSVSVDGIGTTGRQGQEGENVEAQQGGSASKEESAGGGGESAPAADAGGAAGNAEGSKEEVAVRPPKTASAVGNPVDVNVPGEKTSYPARYSVRELADVVPSHNPHNFEPNPAYEYTNDRDYSNPQNAARVAEYSAPGNFKPDYTLTPSPTAEQGAPIIDPRGNALGGNNRTMTLNRVYASNPAGAQAYRDQLAKNAAQYGIDPNELPRFNKPILTRELVNQPDQAAAQKAITDFNKTAAAKLSPEEQAVTDGRRLSTRTVEQISGNLADVGEDSTLAQALRGDKGAQMVQSLVKDGVLTDQEKNGYLDERGQLTPEAKSRIAKALVGRLFEKPGDYAETAPELRNKLEQIAPQVLRVEDRPEWSVTQAVREALGALAEAKAHGIRNLDDLAKQTDIGGKVSSYSPEALAIAKTFQQGPVKARLAFRQYANDAALSRDGAQSAFFEPPTQRESFESAFRGGPGTSPGEVAASKSLRPYNPKASDEVNVANADARFMRGSGAGDGRLYVNEGAMRVLDRVMRDSWGNSVIDVATTNGLTVGRKLAPRVLQSLEGLAGQRGISAAAASAVRRLAQTWRRAMEDGAVVVVASPDATAKFRAKSPDEASLRETVRHELIHREQLRLPGHSFLGHVSAGPLLEHPAVMKAARALIGGGYRPAEVPSEVPAFLASGEYRRLGLTREEALDALEHYFQLIFKQHGDKALSFLARVQPGLRKALYERLDGSIYRQPDGPGGNSPGDSGSGRDKPPERTHPAREPEGRSSAPAGDTSKPGAAGERLPQGRQSGSGREIQRGRAGTTGSLFDQAETDKVTNGVINDRAKLEGERLTAQFDSPLTREEQLKKLKRPKSAQTDLFGGAGNGPEQGVLFSRLRLSNGVAKPGDLVRWTGKADGKEIQGTLVGKDGSDALVKRDGVPFPIAAERLALVTPAATPKVVKPAAPKDPVAAALAYAKSFKNAGPPSLKELQRKFGISVVEANRVRKQAERDSVPKTEPKPVAAPAKERPVSPEAVAYAKADPDATIRDIQKKFGLGVAEANRARKQADAEIRLPRRPGKPVTPATIRKPALDGPLERRYADGYDAYRLGNLDVNGKLATKQYGRLAAHVREKVSGPEVLFSKKLSEPISEDQGKLFETKKQPEDPVKLAERLKGLKYSTARPGELEPGGPKAPAPEPAAEPTLRPRRHYSTAGALQSAFVRNLSELRRASRPAFLAGVKASSYRARAAVILHTAMPLVSKALGDSMPLSDFLRAGTESRLLGRKEFYNDLADQVHRMSDERLASNVDNLVPLLEKVQDRRGLGRNLGHTAVSLADKGDYPLLRAFAEDIFQQAAKAVTSVMSPEEFQNARMNPNFQDALRVYKDHIEKPLAEAHEEHEGVLTTHPGPLKTYFPLTPVTPEKINTATAARQSYARPGNRNNNFATGLADEYDSSMEALRERMVSAIRASGRAGFHDALKEAGLMQPLEKGVGPNGDMMIWNGVPYYAVKRTIGEPRTIVQNGKLFNKPAEQVLLPRWLAGETDPILDKKLDATLPDPEMKEIWHNLKEGRLPGPEEITAMLEKVTQVAVSGVAEPIIHGTNLLGTIIANTPFLGDSLADQALSVPLMKRFGSALKVLQQHPQAEEAAADLRAMAELGILGDHFGGVTFSKHYAEVTGAELARKSLAPGLWGPSGADTRSRLYMYRLAKQIFPEGDKAGMHMFANQLGVYARPLQSHFERAIKGTAIGGLLAPFYTAGSTMTRNAANYFVLRNHGPKAQGYERAKLTAWKWLNSPYALAALWMLTHRAVTGKWPWEDEAAKFMQIPFRLAHVTSENGRKLYKQLWGNAPVGYVGFNCFNPLAGRGARLFGIKGAADTALRGGTWFQDFESAQKDVLNSLAHPFLGPLPRTLFVGAFGHEPYVTSLYDEQDRFHPSFLNAEKTKGGNPFAKRGAATLKELNSFFGGSLEEGSSSMAPELFGTPKKDQPNEWLRMMIELAAPGLVGQAANPARERLYVRRQAAAARRRK